MATREDRWNRAVDFKELIGYLLKKSSRKKRLCAVGCCRNTSHLFSRERSQQLIEESKRFGVYDQIAPVESDLMFAALDWLERYADGMDADESPLIDQVNWLGHMAEFYYACYDDSWGPKDQDLLATSVAAEAINESRWPDVDLGVVLAKLSNAVHRFKLQAGESTDDADQEESSAQCNLIRCVFGNPFRSLAIEPALLDWRDKTITNLALSAYAERELPSGHLDCHRLAVLADALEEAGCAKREVLEHLRHSGPHVRGCWVVDLLIGRE